MPEARYCSTSETRFDRAMEFLVKCPESARKLISHVFPMDRVEEAFATARVPEGSMKVVLSLD